ncbi:MAG: 2-phosphosulfolactate phosphatase XcbC [Methylosarcina sp.]
MVARQPWEAIPNKVLEIGSRLKSAPAESMINSVFALELSHQETLFEAMGQADLAYTLIAMEWNTVPPAAGRQLLASLLKLQEKPTSFKADPARGDMYTNREAWLAEQTESVGWLGVGRARREATTTAFFIVMRQGVLDLGQTIIGLAKVLIAQADAHKLSLMPDYTYLQAAQPTTFGHYLLGFVYPLLRDLERLELLFAQFNRSPMGCGSTNGSRLARGRRQMAELLGFADVIDHGRDAMWQPDLCLESTSILTSCMINLSRLAEDLQVYSTQEFALVELDDSHARASKIMPQKKNPFALTHIRGVANKLIGLLASVSATARTPSGQPDNRLFMYGELPEAMDLVMNAVELMAEVLAKMSFNDERGRQLTTSGWVMATDLTETLVQECGLDFRSAHRLVAYLAGEFSGKNIQDLDHDTVNRFGHIILGQRLSMTENQLRAALDAHQALQARKEPGGTATSCMDHMLRECWERLEGFHGKIQADKIYLATRLQDLVARAEKETGQFDIST